MPKIRFSLHIPLDEYMAYYEGAAEYVVTTSSDGRTVQFPARVLRRFLSAEGIVGEFLLHYDDHRRFIAIEKIRDI